MNEKQLQNKIVRYLKEKKFFYFKFSDRYQYGIPDLYVLINGFSYWFELKSANGILSEIQKKKIESMQKNGGNISVIRDFDKFKEKIENIIIFTSIGGYYE